MFITPYVKWDSTSSIPMGLSDCRNVPHDSIGSTSPFCYHSGVSLGFRAGEVALQLMAAEHEILHRAVVAVRILCQQMRILGQKSGMNENARDDDKMQIRLLFIHDT
jgi:hypothetical protein